MDNSEHEPAIPSLSLRPLSEMPFLLSTIPGGHEDFSHLMVLLEHLDHSDGPSKNASGEARTPTEVTVGQRGDWVRTGMKTGQAIQLHDKNDRRQPTSEVENEKFSRIPNASIPF